MMGGGGGEKGEGKGNELIQLKEKWRAMKLLLNNSFHGVREGEGFQLEGGRGSCCHGWRALEKGKERKRSSILK